METLHDLVKSGKVCYLGASFMWATQFAMMQFVAEKNGWTSKIASSSTQRAQLMIQQEFISIQNHYNLLYRHEELEMNRFCNETGVGLIPVSPKAFLRAIY